MNCPVCYTSRVDCNLACKHSFCYQCLFHWYQECGKNACPMCRQTISIVTGGNTREVHIHCVHNTSINRYVEFYNALNKVRHKNVTLRDIDYLRRQNWVKWVIEHKAENKEYTKYTFHGLQGTTEACYKERQKEQESGICAKTYKD